MMWQVWYDGVIWREWYWKFKSKFKTWFTSDNFLLPAGDDVDDDDAHDDGDDDSDDDDDDNIDDDKVLWSVRR